MAINHRRTTGRGEPSLGKDYFENLFNEVPEAIVISDNAGKIIRINEEFTRMFGYSRQEVVGRQIDELIAPQEPGALAVTASVARGQKMSLEAVRWRKDGSRIHVSILGVPIITHDRQVAVYGIYRDISDRKRAEEALQMEKAYLDQLVETAAEGIVMVDPEGRIKLHNSEFCRMFGYRPEEVAGRCVDDLLLPPELREEGLRLTRKVLEGGRFSMEAVRRRKDGSPLHVFVVGAPITIQGRQEACYAIYRDISAMKEVQEEILESQRLVIKVNLDLQERTRQLEAVNVQLERISNYDGLTAIPNRRYFEHFYDLEWRRSLREQKWITLIMIDVDFFKAFNDRHGHLAGDDCLKQLAMALQIVNRASDLVCRYGGEEFVAVLSGTDPQAGKVIAERMRQRVRNLHLVHGASSVGRYVTVSMGVASQVPQAKAAPEALLLKADQALYLAKSAGRDRIEVMGT